MKRMHISNELHSFSIAWQFHDLTPLKSKANQIHARTSTFFHVVVQKVICYFIAWLISYFSLPVETCAYKSQITGFVDVNWLRFGLVWVCGLWCYAARLQLGLKLQSKCIHFSRNNNSTVANARSVNERKFDIYLNESPFYQRFYIYICYLHHD